MTPANKLTGSALETLAALLVPATIYSRVLAPRATAA
jgi:hypothetical protein